MATFTRVPVGRAGQPAPTRVLSDDEAKAIAREVWARLLALRVSWTADDEQAVKVAAGETLLVLAEKRLIHVEDWDIPA